MRKKYPYLKNYSFLSQIDNLRVKEEYVKITVLTFDDEQPLQEIQGRVSSGSVSVNGKSSVRRTANLTVVLTDDFSRDLTDTKNIISLHKKILLEIGIVNKTSSYIEEYPIIWFPLGIFVISNASFSYSASGATMSLSLKDKMCLLNGDCGGTFPAGVQFDKVQTVMSDGTIEETSPTIYQIIQELVNEWGGEQLGRIIINGVPLKSKNVMKWSPSDTAETLNVVASDNTPVSFSYGKPIGYTYTDFVVPTGTSLIASAGDSICKILDQIVSLLGNYEYFYDAEGRFIFQEIHNYLTTSLTTEIIEGNALYGTDYFKDKAVYVFNNANLISSYANNPQYQNLKNDFVIWGTKKSSSSNTASYGVRYHVAIDSKPAVGNTYKVFKYQGQNDDNDTITYYGVPIEISSTDELPTKYQTDVFYSINDVVYMWDKEQGKYVSTGKTTQLITTTDWRTELYLSGAVSEGLGYGKNYYYSELKNEWTKIYDIENSKFYDDVIKNPENMRYFLDFISPSSKVGQISIPSIGRRTYAKTEKDVNCVLEPDVPNFIILNGEDEDISNQIDECVQDEAQPYIILSNDNFEKVSLGSAFTSAYSNVRSIIYKYTSLCENITLQTIPIYYLEPNQRISVYDEVSGIEGDYIIETISYPLDINSLSNITATRALEMI